MLWWLGVNGSEVQKKQGLEKTQRRSGTVLLTIEQAKNIFLPEYYPRPSVLINEWLVFLGNKFFEDYLYKNS